MKDQEYGGHQDHSISPIDSTAGRYDSWQVEYLKMIYQQLTGEIRQYLNYIERATFWGTGVLLGTAGYLTTNVKQIPFLGKLILMAAVLLFGGSLSFPFCERLRT